MAPWHKSTYSGDGSACVEVSEGATVLMRDTQHRELGHLEYPATAWTALLQHVKTEG
ncbi:DUF397 domain-containing protein [Nocardiopsis sp. NPDC006198]|uniref:DUF397 domain-containing protein n=1 Tax=Nocardiopsis sp. NPDC006198 TaxID=3154472 RepID=UPI0033A4D386